MSYDPLFLRSGTWDRTKVSRVTTERPCRWTIPDWWRGWESNPHGTPAYETGPAPILAAPTRCVAALRAPGRNRTYVPWVRARCYGQLQLREHVLAYARRESNPHVRRHLVLSQARLPLRHGRLFLRTLGESRTPTRRSGSPPQGDVSAIPPRALDARKDGDSNPAECYLSALAGRCSRQRCSPSSVPRRGIEPRHHPGKSRRQSHLAREA